MPHKVTKLLSINKFTVQNQSSPTVPLSLRLCGVSCDDTQIKERNLAKGNQTELGTPLNNADHVESFDRKVEK
jgi:hypothetical protein